MKSKPIHVSYVTVGLGIGGAETQLVRLVNGLDRDRFKPSIVCLSDESGLEGALAGDVELVKPSRAHNATRGGMGRIAAGRRAMSMIGGELRRHRPDVVHAYLAAAYVPASLAARQRRVPVIVAGRRGFTSGRVYGSAWWRALTGLANRVIDVQICNSNAVREAAVVGEGVKRERTRVIYNGIDLPSLNRVALPPEMASVDSQAVMIANFIPYKGHVPILQAVARVVREHPRFRLVLIGDGPERSALERLTGYLGLGASVIFAGRRTDAAELVEGFDFSILGSSEESFPNALMESMAAAVPVISTRVGGVSELVDDRVHGLLVPFGDVGAMAEAITWMLDHPDERRQMGEEGRRRIATDFSTERMVRATEAVYQEFLQFHLPAIAGRSAR
jgi:glycosyltransferase involved in cell wall biosynthesis